MFFTVFGSFGIPFWSHVGAIFGTFLVQKGARNEKRDFHENACFLVVFFVAPGPGAEGPQPLV